MKKEVRNLFLVEIKCRESHTVFIIFRGPEEIEHFGLIPGSSTEALRILREEGLMEEVKNVLRSRYGDAEEAIHQAKSLFKNWRFINRVLKETHRLICREDVNTI